METLLKDGPIRASRFKMGDEYLSAESFSIEVVGSDVRAGVDIVVEGLDVDPEADTDVLAFWAGPII
jgi:hypothetical protein